MDGEVLHAAQVLWDYHRLGMPVADADVIVVLGSYDTRVAEHVADLFLAGRAPWLLFTGGVVQPPERMRAPWPGVEAEVFRAIALERGVPAERILVEARATNTGENFRFSEALLRERGIAARRVLVATLPFMERRALATGLAQTAWPEIRVTSPPESCRDFCFSRFDPRIALSEMAAALQRLAIYPARGYSTPQEIPAPVWDAYRLVVARGYRWRLLPDVTAGPAR